MVTDAPTAPDVGDRVLIVGVGRTVNEGPVTETPLAVTATVPVVAPVGTTATIDEAPQLVIDVAAVPLNLSVPFVVPKPDPLIVTEEPTAPEVGDRLPIAGVGKTVNAEPLLDTPLAVTTTLPVVAPLGTTATIDEPLQLVIDVAAVPLNLTVPFVVPKLVPAIVTEAPTAPDVGDRLLIVGVAAKARRPMLPEQVNNRRTAIKRETNRTFSAQVIKTISWRKRCIACRRQPQESDFAKR